MTVKPLPTDYLVKDRNVSISSAQTKMEAGSDIHRITLGFDPIIEKQTLKWVAPPEAIASMYQLFCVTDNLVGIYSFNDPVMGVSHWQPDGDLSWQQSGMKRWPASLPVRRV